MNRRTFLNLLATAATAVLDPEKLLWRPGAKKIFVPPGAAFKYEITEDQLLLSCLGILRENLKLANYSRPYSDHFRRLSLK